MLEAHGDDQARRSEAQRRYLGWLPILNRAALLVDAAFIAVLLTGTALPREWAAVMVGVCTAADLYVAHFITKRRHRSL